MNKVFVSHPRHMLEHYFGARAADALKAIADVTFNTECRELTTDELAIAARDADAIIGYRQTPAPRALFAALPNLAAFVRCAVDIRTVDVDAASEHGVLVTQASAGFVPAVAEWVIGAMLDLGRFTTFYAEAYHQRGAPAPRMGRQLRGSTLGVIGYGQISRCLCDLALAFGMRVIVSDPFAEVKDGRVRQSGLDTLLAESDFVVCLAPANAKTHNLMNASAFEAMKPGAYFINAARGELVDDAALLDALDRGHLAGCALDVGRAPDQMPSPALALHPRVIATPHVGGLTPAAIEHQSMETVAQTEALFQGRIPPGAVNAPHALRLARFDAAAHTLSSHAQ
ncbi:NAD(P)-dependent oxidoreductase [Caballeronia ptereochthonis]|uniref:D-3-phosphoglycerate dehydrogenase n=1 Tax=Caballeronia ptereochthonis TaxID=1777144 RepID=A0A157ZCX9_9BURK|nr:NAD(P)-dependent oxidoreductase [Caballeronia ptereochthonis]SAK43380.1 D-3-phosphoglycerate dehydrogenase [Caballeronia ptereochthonis]